MTFEGENMKCLNRFETDFIPAAIREVTEELKKNYEVSDESEYDMSGDFGCKFRITEDDLTVEVTVHYCWLGDNIDRGFFIKQIGKKGETLLDDSVCHPLSRYSKGVSTLVDVLENGKPVEFCKEQIKFFTESLKYMEVA